MSKNNKFYLGIFEGHYDPAAAIVCDGKVLAYIEEERCIRSKHAYKVYPTRSIQYCLDVADVKLSELAGVGINWNLPDYSNGKMATFFEEMKKEYAVDSRTEQWQRWILGNFNESNYRKHHEANWCKNYGQIKFPKLIPFPHHYVHAIHAAWQSPFNQSLVVTIDGSGDQHCTVLWKHEEREITPIREIFMPNSLGWFYSAFTEYLGFSAYDGEYKVMGLAAYGKQNLKFQKAVSTILKPAEDGVEYRIDPTYLHYGPRTYSDRFTDKLVELFGRPPRLPSEEITSWHENLAYAVQEALEKAVERLVIWGVDKIGNGNVCIGGGVGLNVKMNSKLFKMKEVTDLFAQPLCSDGGAAVGAALAACQQETGVFPERVQTMALGHKETNEQIEATLKLAQLNYDRSDNICEETAKELANGRIVGWFQGRMEAGPRSLGQRSILADPRNVENRDKVNAIIKFREYWRPFCPSILAEAADRYFDNYTEAPFMIIAFDANERLSKEAPAIVHVDGTSRVQFVKKDVLPRYHQLLTEFEKLTQVPVLLNTSFNIKGEPIVCDTKDALRTFWSTGLDILVVGDFIVRKPKIKT